MIVARPAKFPLFMASVGTESAGGSERTAFQQILKATKEKKLVFDDRAANGCAHFVAIERAASVGRFERNFVPHTRDSG